MEEEVRAKIKEIFSSIQGEGLCIGAKQIFIRFCACNLKCSYCDTDFLPNNIYDIFNFTPSVLLNHLERGFDIDSHHSISLTGGEPLIWVEFLKEFLPLFKSKYTPKIYLETNATLADSMKELSEFIDIISADIKLPSCSGVKNSFEMHDKFFDAVPKKFYETNNIYAKVVFDNNITEEEIKETVKLANNYQLPLILQPRMIGKAFSVNSEFMVKTFENFTSKYTNTRFIPQVHKYIDVE